MLSHGHIEHTHQCIVCGGGDMAVVWAEARLLDPSVSGRRPSREILSCGCMVALLPTSRPLALVLQCLCCCPAARDPSPGTRVGLRRRRFCWPPLKSRAWVGWTADHRADSRPPPAPWALTPGGPCRDQGDQCVFPVCSAAQSRARAACSPLAAPAEQTKEKRERQEGEEKRKAQKERGSGGE